MTTPAPGRRRMAVRSGALLVAAIAATATALAHSASAGPAAPAAAGSSVFSVAPYVDMSNGQEPVLDTAITGHGLKAYTAAFVIGTGCTQEWGDTLPVGNDSYTDPEIARAKSEGASVIISSGGAAGEPLAWTCTNQSSDPGRLPGDHHRLRRQAARLRRRGRGRGRPDLGHPPLHRHEGAAGRQPGRCSSR